MKIDNRNHIASPMAQQAIAYAAVTLGSDYRTIFKIGRADSIFSPIGSV